MRWVACCGLLVLLTGACGAGQDGRDGRDGRDGEDGRPGADGSSCTVTSSNGAAVVSCEDGTEAVIGSGAGGGAGAASLSALISTDLLEPGAECPAGGFLFEAGVDQNADGFLASDEVSDRQYVCHGTPGEDGAPGQDGDPGQDGTRTLVAVTTEIDGRALQGVLQCGHLECPGRLEDGHREQPCRLWPGSKLDTGRLQQRVEEHDASRADQRGQQRESSRRDTRVDLRQGLSWRGRGVQRPARHSRQHPYLGKCGPKIDTRSR